MEKLARSRALASRYARVLLEVAVSEADPRAVERELASFVALFDEHPALGRVLRSRSVPVARKLAVILEITERARYAAPLEKLLKLMAERDHLALLQHLLDAYRRRLMEHLGIVQAQVTTAVPLSPERQQAVEQALAQAMGRHVMMTTQVDPAIIGGVVTKVDSTVFDGSVARHLERIREKMVERV